MSDIDRYEMYLVGPKDHAKIAPLDTPDGEWVKYSDHLAAIEANDVWLAFSDEDVARMFHEHYERLAPGYGYETRPESRCEWGKVQPELRALMTHVVSEVRVEIEAAVAAERERCALIAESYAERAIGDPRDALFIADAIREGDDDTR